MDAAVARTVPLKVSSERSRSGHLAEAPGRRSRLLGVDVLRAVAILGMVWAHFNLTGWLSPAPAGKPPAESVSWINDLLGTRSREIFFLLAGVSLALMTGGHRPHTGKAGSTARKRVAVRAAVLFVLALVLGFLGKWEPQILHFYALWLLLLLPLSRLRVRTLLIISGVLAVAAPLFKVAANRAGTSWPFLPDPMDPKWGHVHGGFSLLLHPGDWWPTLQNVMFGLGGNTQDTVSVLPFLVLGLALGRMELHSHTTRLRLLTVGAGTAIAAIACSLIAMYPLDAVDAVHTYKNPPAAAALPAAPTPPADAAPAKTDPGIRQVAAPGPQDVPTPPDMPPPPKAPWQELVTMGHPGPAEKTLSMTEGMAMLGLISALLGGLLILMDKHVWQRLLRPFAAFGSMALTWYFAHFMILDLLPTGGGGGPGIPAGRSVLAFVVFTLAALAASLIWRRYLRRGPLEWLTHQIIVRCVPGPRTAHRHAAP
ncbi:DUF418 domain-containing protein [Streptomyces kronopolitis]|uniref:DUF418 domain-containing protein n=1 Tax=Streptomyces kronopolitis TaxID=1612435 RepID=UPI003436F026